MKSVWGIYREARFSPGRVDDDEAILRHTATHLQERGLPVTLLAAEELPGRVGSPPLFAFIMCQGATALAVLDRWHARGILSVNSPQAIRNCYRRTMIARLRAAEVSFPPSRIIDTHQPDLSGIEFSHGPWIKRGDFHAVETGDVERVWRKDVAAACVRRLAARGIRHAIVQDHMEGEEVKFYGISRTGFFRGFPALDGTWLRRVQALAERAATALGVEVYGGDAVVTPGGEIYLIDINDWPSFARCRTEAAAAISDYLLPRIKSQCQS